MPSAVRSGPQPVRSPPVQSQPVRSPPVQSAPTPLQRLPPPVQSLPDAVQSCVGPKPKVELDADGWPVCFTRSQSLVDGSLQLAHGGSPASSRATSVASARTLFYPESCNEPEYTIDPNPKRRKDTPSEQPSDTCYIP